MGTTTANHKLTARCRHVPSHRRRRPQSRNSTPRRPRPRYRLCPGRHRRRHHLLHRPRPSRLARRVHPLTVHLLLHDGLRHQHHLRPGAQAHGHQGRQHAHGAVPGHH